MNYEIGPYNIKVQLNKTIDENNAQINAEIRKN